MSPPANEGEDYRLSTHPHCFAQPSQLDLAIENREIVNGQRPPRSDPSGPSRKHKEMVACVSRAPEESTTPWNRCLAQKQPAMPEV